MPNPMLKGITHHKRKKINIIPWSRPKSLFHVSPEWTSNVIYCETRRGQGSELLFGHHLKTEPLFSHHIPVYTSCKPTLVWPRSFVNTCISALLLIRHTHKYWSLQIFGHCPHCQNSNLGKIRGNAEEDCLSSSVCVVEWHPPSSSSVPVYAYAGCSCLRGIAWSFIISSRLSNQTMNRLLKIDDYIEVHMSKKAFI